MVVCGEGGEVFMVPPSRDRESLKWPTHKDPEKGILLMVLNNGVMHLPSHIWQSDLI